MPSASVQEEFELTETGGSNTGNSTPSYVDEKPIDEGYLTGWKLAMLVIAVTVAFFTVLLDTSIVVTVCLSSILSALWSNDN